MPKSQEQQILEYLKAGNSLTPIQALNFFGVFRLGARVFDLIQQGYPIKSELVKGENGKHFSRYWLAEQPTMPQAKAETPQGGDITHKVGIPEAAEPPRDEQSEMKAAERPAFMDIHGQYAFMAG